LIAEPLLQFLVLGAVLFVLHGSLGKRGVEAPERIVVSTSRIANLADGFARTWHGDIGRPEVMAWLRRIAPVSAIRGNVDIGEWAEHYPDTRTVRLGGRTIYLLHNLQELQLDPSSCGVTLEFTANGLRSSIHDLGSAG
jgi:hypothetical protein